MFLEHTHHVSISDGVVGAFRLSLTLFLLFEVDVDGHGKIGRLRKHGQDVIEDMVVQRRIFGF